MSINSLIHSSDPSLPFVPLEGESILLLIPKAQVQFYPLMDNNKVNTKYEQKIETVARGFVTTRRLILLLPEPFEGLENIAILYKQMVVDAAGQIPPNLNMPWLGQNYLSMSFKVLPEQINGNGTWLNYIYTWICKIYVDSPVNKQNIFQLHDTLKKAIIEDNSTNRTEDVDPLPAYTP